MDTGNFQCIAVDMGASSIRVMLGTLAEGKLSYEEKHRFKNEIKEVDGHERWDIEMITREILVGVEKIIKNKRTNVSSIGVDSWGVDFVLLDKKGEILDLPVAYRDNRTAGMKEKWLKEMSAEETFQKTGINFYDFNTLFHLLSIRDQKIIDDIGTILFMPCYISYFLSGEKLNEVTIASTSQIMNVGNSEMNDEILHKLNLNAEHFGRIISPGTKIGKMTKGNNPDDNTEVVSVCGHDTACAVTAVPSDSEDFAFIATGTWCIAGTLTKKPVTNEFALNENFTNERGFMNDYRLVKNIIGLWLVQGLKNSFGDKYDYFEIEKLAGNSSCYNLVYPDNEMFYNPGDMKEAFDQFFMASGQEIPKEPGDYFKCAYDSLCLSFRMNIEKLESMMNKKYDVIHLIGGGCQSKYLSSLTATICEKTVVSGPVEGATIGNILIQGMAAGVIDSISEARNIVKVSFPVEKYQPAETDHTELKKTYNRFIKLNEIKF